MIRVTNYFETQIQIPLGNRSRDGANGTLHFPQPGSKGYQDMFPVTDKPMTDEQVLGWYSKILDGVKQRYRKLQRLSR